MWLTARHGPRRCRSVNLFLVNSENSVSNEKIWNKKEYFMPRHAYIRIRVDRIAADEKIHFFARHRESRSCLVEMHHTTPTTYAEKFVRGMEVIFLAVVAGKWLLCARECVFFHSELMWVEVDFEERQSKMK